MLMHQYLYKYLFVVFSFLQNSVGQTHFWVNTKLEMCHVQGDGAMKVGKNKNGKIH